MAPFLPSNEITDLDFSSLELDARSTTMDELISRALPAYHSKRDDISSVSSPIEVYDALVARDSSSVQQADYGGAVDPNSINMKGLQALFAIIGALFVVAIIWFFFWAKNGGFQWRKGDWDDYKSTVLRRKGPNGTTLSNATKSTKLGGGSIVGDGYSDDAQSTIEGTFTETMTVTDMSSEAPIMNRSKKETVKERKIREAKEAAFEGGHDGDVLAYIREKPARVGGINKDSDAFHYGTDYTDTEGSAIHNVRESRSQVNRGPASNSSRQASPQKRQSRRDFSYGNDDAFSSAASSHPDVVPTQYPEVAPAAPPHRPGRYHSPSKQFDQPNHHRNSQYAHTPAVPGSYHEPSVVSDVQSQNTISYHHPLPALSGQRQNHNSSPARGYRRDRRDSLDD